MKERFKMVHFDRCAEQTYSSAKRFGYETAVKANAFHTSFPEYGVTPLADLGGLAGALGIKGLYVKDESYRFGLNAFKVLGGSYAIGHYIAERLGTDISELSYARITSGELRKQLGDLTFITATDGNHGRGIAWTANRLKQKSVVYMPKGSAEERLKNIRALGAEASITDLVYDDAVRLAYSDAKKHGWIMMQDTAWEGYEEIPAWIMQGYTTMAYEAISQMKELPTHVFLQAGVGSMAGAITGFFTDLYGGERPIITIVEPSEADCIYRTAKANDGRLHFAEGDMYTIMAGLACGEPCSIAWDMLRDYADNFVSVPDAVAAEGMRILGNPMRSDVRVISGESGAATLGFVAEVMRNECHACLREQLGLDGNSRVLCFSTEGDTDPENYRRIVWDGQNPSCKTFI